MTQMPPLPGHGSHLEAYGCSSLRGCGPHDGGRVCACPSAVTLKAAVSRAAESDCQTDRTRRLSAVIRRRDRSGSSRPRSERRAFTVPAAGKNNKRRRLGLQDLLSSYRAKYHYPSGTSSSITDGVLLYCALTHLLIGTALESISLTDVLVSTCSPSYPHRLIVLFFKLWMQ